MNDINPAYIGIPSCSVVKEAVSEWEYQQSRIRFCEEIIKQKPGTPAARNARKLIADIKEQLGVYK